MRAYELMVIVDGDVDDAGVQAVLTRITELIEGLGAAAMVVVPDGVLTTSTWAPSLAPLRKWRCKSPACAIPGCGSTSPGVTPVCACSSGVSCE